MLALEFVTDPTTKTPAKDLTAAIATEAYQRGVIVLKTGLFSNCIRMLVPLVITDEQLQEGLSVIEAAIATVANSTPARV
jgi:4-aminobutyrate aminotransferase/(S)-3-amino-2-methylpropionate transaminase